MASIVDLSPAGVICRAYQGDPFDWQIYLTLPDGSPADVSKWLWLSWIDVGAGQVIAWQTDPQPDGVALYLRGADTIRLPERFCNFDVHGRDPDAGEGRTVVAGQIIANPRVTPPLRGSAEAAPTTGVLV